MRSRENKTIDDTQHINYAIKVCEKYYDGSKNELDIEDIKVVIREYDNFEKDIDSILDMEKKYGSDVANAIVVTAYYDDIDKGINKYRRVFYKYDYLFIKLMVRIKDIHESITELNKEDFLKFMEEYSSLRRVIPRYHLDENFMDIMDYEGELLKYGKMEFSGKPADNYSYENLLPV